MQHTAHVAAALRCARVQVFPTFQLAGRLLGALLEQLEPHILSDDFEYLAPEVMQALVEYFSSRVGRLGRRCCA
jgi:hypothetical protein